MKKITPPFIDFRGRAEKLYMVVRLMEDEFQAVNPDYKRMNERKGIFKAWEDEIAKKEKRKSKEKGYFSFGLVMLIVLVGVVAAMGVMQYYSVVHKTQERHEKIDYYEILGIEDRKIPAKRIRRFFMKATLATHPDHNPNCGEECVVKMVLVNEAHVILMNPETRKFHDQYGVRPPESMVRLAKLKHGSGRRKKKS